MDINEILATAYLLTLALIFAAYVAIF